MADEIYPVTIDKHSGTAWAGRYELQDRVGVGGMGTVYRGRDKESGAIVAVKVLHGRGQSDSGRFAQEAEILARLQHPAIVRFIEHGVSADGQPYIVMNWLEGETLESRMRQGNLLPSWVAKLASRACAGLAEAHRQGVVHRDVKPSNIFLHNHRADQALILDFGVARSTVDPKNFTKKGSTVGTPTYISPEQARAEDQIDGRADIFSLGCVLFEALTGEAAFSGDSPAAVMTRICAGEPPYVSERAPGVDNELAATIQDMMIQDREDRPADAERLAFVWGAMAQRLEPLDVKAPVQPRPPRGMWSRDTLSRSEQRMMTLLLVTLGAPDGPDVEGEESAPRRRAFGSALFASIVAVAEPYGGRADQLLDRTLVVTVPPGASADHQAASLGLMALELRRMHGGLTMALGSGPGVLLARMPTGQVIEKAADALQLGVPGEIVADRETAEVIAHRFDLQRCGPSGQGDPSFFTIKGALSEERPRGLHGRASALQGRQRELNALQGVFEECVDDEEARLVVVQGDAGVGKTRLVQTFVDQLATLDDCPQILRARGTAQRGGVSYKDLQALLTGAGVAPGNGSRDPLAVLDAWTDWLGQQLQKHPTLILIEDAHLLDGSSVQLIDATLRCLRDGALMIVLVARPSATDRLPQYFGSDRTEWLRLGDLSTRHARSLMAENLSEGSPDLENWILARGRGNPFHIETLCRWATGVFGGPLPFALLGSVQPHLDVFDEAARRVLRAASVFPDGCNADALASLLGMGAPELKAMLALLCEKGVLLPSGDSDPVYRFDDVLKREVVCSTLAPGDRAVARRLARAVIDDQGMNIPLELQPGRTFADAPSLSVPVLPRG